MKYNIGDIIQVIEGGHTYKVIGNGYDGEAKYYIVNDEITGNTARITETEAEHTELVASYQQVKKGDKQEITDDKDTAQQITSKLKLIDVLNKIANGELKEGTKVVCNNSTFEYRKLHKDSGRNTLDLYSKNNTSLINATYLTPVLSFEVELIEPQEPTECEHEWEEYGMYNTKTKEDKHFRKCIKCDLEEEIEPTDNTTEKIEELECGDKYGGITARIINKLNEVIREINKEGNNE